MEFFALIIICFIVYLLIKNFSSEKNKSVEYESDYDVEDDSEYEINVTSSRIESEDLDPGSLKNKSNETWVLNPKSHLPITISNTDKQTASELKSVLDRTLNEYDYNDNKKVSEILLRNKIIWNDLNDFFNEYKTIYLKELDKMKEDSTEWSISSDLDKKDLIQEFQEKVIENLYVQLTTDMELLFSDIPPITDQMVDFITKYNYKNIEFYLRNYDKRDIVKRINADNRYRKNYEELVQVGLAIRGNQIQQSDLLSILKIAEMEELIQDLDHEKIHRKAKLIEFLMELSDLDDRLRKRISYRELFKIDDLPSPYSKINISELMLIFKYYKIVSEIMMNTYTNGSRDYEDYHDAMKDLSYVEGWEVSSWNTKCPMCLNKQNITYDPKDRPKVPFHINCNCHVQYKLNDSE